MKCVWMCALFLFTLIHGGWTIGDQRCSNEPHCRLDPEVNMNITQIIRRWGYPAEEHEVVTEDGYILTVNRIPHGLRHSAGGFLILFQFFVVVFTYTSTLIKISYDEMALKDLPAVINHVLKVTGQEKIFYIGHSQGTTIAFIAFSTLPELASKIRLFLGLAPVATVAFTCSPVTKLSKLPECLIRGLFGKRDFLPQSRYIKWLAEHVCAKKCLDELCGNLFFVICGYDKKNLNMTRIPVYTTHSPAGTSVQNMIHWAQELRAFMPMMWSGQLCQGLTPGDVIGGVVSTVHIPPVVHVRKALYLCHSGEPFVAQTLWLNWLIPADLFFSKILNQNPGSGDKWQWRHIEGNRCTMKLYHILVNSSEGIGWSLEGAKLWFMRSSTLPTSMSILYPPHNLSTPPEFRVKDMKVPTALFSGGHDTLADPKDMAVLLTQVSNLVYHQHIEHWEHLDFIWGMDAPQVMFPSILKLLQQHQ
ncbi:PREDICTED: lysosomal acid lipase/cholesteryl ester hydrolase-like [Cyprinodon variegatus]|uniref:lysosomal acid lipase/cholesteryl ester hydrolase-like n=1 Tax=Cyprinodon variegatus TaxID=28743 RepID=UPI000742687E|nr:PREDICTED: lysosomal acid lipase/cholesteryl ester hydrolase-like [Cyprinodon variegatus]